MADGSATFAGSVESASWKGRANNLGYSISPNGAMVINGDAGGYALRIYEQNTNNVSYKIDLNADGSAVFKGSVTSTNFEAQPAAGANNSTWTGVKIKNSGGSDTTKLFADGSAEFSGEVTVTSRSQKWVLTEQGGICYMMSPSSEFDEGFSQSPPRDIIKELDQLKELVQTLMNSRNEKD